MTLKVFSDKIWGRCLFFPNRNRAHIHDIHETMCLFAMLILSLQDDCCITNAVALYGKSIPSYPFKTQDIP